MAYASDFDAVRMLVIVQDLYWLKIAEYYFGAEIKGLYSILHW